MSETRQVFKLTESGEKEIHFFDLQKDDLFRLVEPNGEPVTFKGKEIFIALGNPYYNKDCTPEIHMKDYDPKVLH